MQLDQRGQSSPRVSSHQGMSVRGKNRSSSEDAATECSFRSFITLESATCSPRARSAPIFSRGARSPWPGMFCLERSTRGAPGPGGSTILLQR